MKGNIKNIFTSSRRYNLLTYLKREEQEITNLRKTLKSNKNKHWKLKNKKHTLFLLSEFLKQFDITFSSFLPNEAEKRQKAKLIELKKLTRMTSWGDHKWTLITGVNDSKTRSCSHGNWISQVIEQCSKKAKVVTQVSFQFSVKSNNCSLKVESGEEENQLTSLGIGSSSMTSFCSSIITSLFSASSSSADSNSSESQYSSSEGWGEETSS